MLPQNFRGYSVQWALADCVQILMAKSHGGSRLLPFPFLSCCLQLGPQPHSQKKKGRKKIALCALLEKRRRKIAAEIMWVEVIWCWKGAAHNTTGAWKRVCVQCSLSVCVFVRVHAHWIIVFVIFPFECQSGSRFMWTYRKKVKTCACAWAPCTPVCASEPAWRDKEAVDSLHKRPCSEL